MRILVLEQGTKERSLIQQVLQAGKHEVILAENARQGWESINAGETRFVIADAELSDVIAFELVHRVRAAGLPPVYFLLLTSHEEHRTEADDTLHKPLRAAELQTRVAIGQRILAMGDSLSQARDQLENTAMYDPLTGMMNQAAFRKFLDHELERARRSSSALSIIALNIDNFKVLNNSHGAETGDNILKLVAQNIRGRRRPYDSAGRWADAEFMIALLNVNGVEAEKIAQRLITGIRFTQISHQGAILNLDISAGIATIAAVAESTEAGLVIEQARQALAHAKDVGGYQIYLVNA